MNGGVLCCAKIIGSFSKKEMTVIRSLISLLNVDFVWQFDSPIRKWWEAKPCQRKVPLALTEVGPRDCALLKSTDH